MCLGIRAQQLQVQGTYPVAVEFQLTQEILFMGLLGVLHILSYGARVITFAHVYTDLAFDFKQQPLSQSG